MMRRVLCLCISMLCMLALLSLAMVKLTQASPKGQSEMPAGNNGKAEAIYQIRLPVVMNHATTPKITIWHWWVTGQIEEYQKIVNEYNYAHPDTPIRLIYIQNMDEAISAAIPVGAGPDIILYPNDLIGKWASAGYLEPLNSWIDIAYMNANFEPITVQGVVWEDQIWGIPDSQEGIGMVYNRDLITDTEIPEPSDWDGFLDKAELFQLANPEKYYMCNQGLGGLDAYHNAPIYFGHGLDVYGGYLDAQGTVYMTTTEAISGAMWIDDYSPLGPYTSTYGSCLDMFISERAAIWWTGPWVMNDIHNSGIDYGIAPMGSPFVGVKNYMLTSNAVARGNADTAVQIMQYLGSAEVQKRVTLANHTIPANTAALNDPEVQAIYDVARFGLALSTGIPMGNHIYVPCQWDPVGVATNAIWFGWATPLEAMVFAQIEMEACVAGIGP